MKPSFFFGLCSAGILMLASMVPASAQTLVDTQTQVFSLKATDYTPGGINKITFNRYNGANPLTKVTVRLLSRIEADQKVENQETGSTANITLTTTGIARITKSDFTTDIVTASAQVQNTFFAEEFDGNNDFGGTSGKSFLDFTNTATNAVDLTDASSLAAFTGAGTIDLGVGGTGVTSASGSANLLQQFATQVGADVEVNYYTGSGTELVPEPGSLALVLPGLAPLALMLRRRSQSEKRA